MHRRGPIQVLFASLFALGLATAVTGCPRAGNGKGGRDVSLNGEKNLTNGVWLFGYDATQARNLVTRAKSNDGLIPVHLSMDADGEAHLSLVGDCHVAGKYQYQTGTGIEDHITITSEDQAKAMLPYSFLSFAGEYKQSSHFEIHYRSPGDYVAPSGAFQLTGSGCSQTTHVITQLTVGAFKTTTGNQVSAGGSGGVNGGPQVGGGTQSGNSQATSGGDIQSCGGGAAPAQAPGIFGIPGFAPPVLPMGGAPDQCSHPLKLTLAPVNGVAPQAGDKNATGSSVACQDSGLMSATSLGFHFDGSVFTLQSDQLKSVDPDVKHDFACVGAIAPAEAFAMDKIILFLKARPAVQAHVSVSCTPLFMGPNASDLHMNMLRAKFAAAGLTARVTFDQCATGMFNPIPVGNGVHVELIAGCADIPSPPKPKCSK